MDPAIASKRKPKARARGYSLALLKYPQGYVDEFNRAWEQWPCVGWNFSSKTESPRRINYDRSLERFIDILANTDIQIDGNAMTAKDLADVMIHYAVRVKRQSHGNTPNCCCIENFLSCVEGNKHPWKEEVLYMSGAIKQ